MSRITTGEGDMYRSQSLGGSLRSEVFRSTRRFACELRRFVFLMTLWLHLCRLITFLSSCFAGGRQRGDQISRQRWVFTRHLKCPLLRAELVNACARKHNKWVSGELMDPRISIFQNLSLVLCLASISFFIILIAFRNQKAEGFLNHKILLNPAVKVKILNEPQWLVRFSPNSDNVFLQACRLSACWQKGN